MRKLKMLCIGNMQNETITINNSSIRSLKTQIYQEFRLPCQNKTNTTPLQKAHISYYDNSLISCNFRK